MDGRFYPSDFSLSENGVARPAVDSKGRMILSDTAGLGGGFKGSLDHRLSMGPIVAAIGTSITDQNTKNVIPPNAGPGRAYMNDGYMTWWRILSDQRINFPVEYDFGRSADTFPDILARLGDVAAVKPHIVAFEGGSNDLTVYDFETMKNNWLLIMKALINMNATVFVIPMPPRNGTFLTTAQVQQQMRFTNYQREWCHSHAGAVFCDYLGYFLDQTSTASVALANLLKDDLLHPAISGGFYMGKLLFELSDRWLPPRPTNLLANADIYHAVNNPTGNLLYSGTANRGLLAGTGGTETANANLTYTGGGTGGGLATGLNFLRGSATSVCTVTNTKENPRTDPGRSSGERQVTQIACNSGGGADEVYNLRLSPAFADVQAGDVYFAEVQVEVTAAPANMNALELYVLETRSSGGNYTAVDGSYNSTLAKLMPPVTWKGTLRTPPIERTVEATAIQANVRARMKTDTGAANVTFKTADFALRKVHSDFYI